MATFNIRNLLTQSVGIYYIDFAANQIQLFIPPKETATFEAVSLHPNTVAQIDNGYIVVVDGPVPVSSVVIPPAQGQGMIWGDVWRPGVLYRTGMVFKYGGVGYLVVIQHESTTVPTPADVRLEVIFNIDPTSFLGVDVSAAVDGAVFFRDSGNPADWDIAKITDFQVSAISTSKITGLDSQLSGKVSRSGDTMTGFLVLAADPINVLDAVTKQYSDKKLPLVGGTMTGPIILAGTPVSGLGAVPKNYVDSTLGASLPKSGGTMTGFLVLAANPISALDAATKSYTDTKLPFAGGLMTGPIILSGPPTNALHATTRTYVDARALAGGTMTGFLKLFANPTDNLHATPKQYVDAKALAGGTLTGILKIGATTPTADADVPSIGIVKNYLDGTIGAGYVRLTGDTLTGFLVLAADPINPLDAATKGYVDSLTGGGSGFLALTGGTMTGAIGGAHGLLPITAGAGSQLTGALVLHEVATDPDGLYETLNGDLAYRGADVSLQGNKVSVSVDYTVLANDGLVEVDASGSTVIITLLNVSGYQAFPKTIKKTAGAGAVVVQLPSDGASNANLVLTAPDESITLFPFTDWDIIGRYKPTERKTSAGLTVGAEAANVIKTTVQMVDHNVRSDAITAITNEGGGNIGFTVGTAIVGFWTIGNSFSVLGTATNDGVYTILSKTATGLVAAGTFTATGTGFLRGTASKNTAESIEVIAILSGSKSDPYVDPSVDLAPTVANGYLINTTFNTTYLSTLGNGTFAINVTDSVGGAKTAYLHILSGGDASIRGSKIFNVASAVKTTSSFSSVSEGDNPGTDAWFTLAEDSGFDIGDEVVITSSLDYDGSYTIQNVDTGGSRILLPVPFGVTNSGTATNQNNVTLTMTEAITAILVGDGLIVEGVTYLNGLNRISTVVNGKVAASFKVMVAEDPDVAGNTSGTATVPPVATLTFA